MPKRINFISTQSSQTTNCVNYTPMPARTGYERVMAHRTDELFAKTAKGAGKITALSDKVITVTYDDGTSASYEIGRRFGVWAGNTVPHTIVTRFKQGDTVKEGDVLVYNTSYFTPDTMDPSQVIMKFGLLARVALLESPDTYEDSSAISEALSARLVTEHTDIRYIKVTYDQEVRNLVKVGEIVEPDTILCKLHASTAGNNDIFDDEALSILDILATTSPKAKKSGKVDKIEVLYTGELEDMSATIRSLAEISDNSFRKFNKQLGLRATDGMVDIGFRVGGQPLESNTAMIKVYITGSSALSVGDKVVYCNQMKSVIGRVLTGIHQSEDGVPFDATFSYDSFVRRTVLSPELVGTTNSLALLIGKALVKAYES